MKITDIITGSLSVPLNKPFKTALRTVSNIEDIVVKITTDTGHIGYGEAAPTAFITGDTRGAIVGAIEECIKPALLGLELEDFEDVLRQLDTSLLYNYSAKAAVDMALYDLYGQMLNIPVYKMLGGKKQELTTDITISLNEPWQMALDSQQAIALGYTILKIKVGCDTPKDLKRLKAIREAVGNKVTLRLDANQGWKPKEAVSILHTLEIAGMNIEFVEQPVHALDIEGLKFVTDHVTVPVMADESVFSPKDAIRVIQTRSADLVNIKLMKCGGIHHALHICALAELYDVECMIGCMLEANISITAAAHLACGKRIITKIDLDGPALCEEYSSQRGCHFYQCYNNVTGNTGPRI
jgi:o-succinylbenzoate synthase